MEYGRHVVNANSMLTHKRNGEKSPRSVVGFLIADKMGTEKLLIFFFPTFACYHSGYNFGSELLQWKSSEQQLIKSLEENFLVEESEKGERVKNLGVINNESSLLFIQKKKSSLHLSSYLETENKKRSEISL